MWIVPFLSGGLIGKFLSLGLNFAYEILLRIVSFVFYLASEYWGRWVIAAFVMACALLYARWHYIEMGRAEEASFRALIVQSELEQRCIDRGGKLTDAPNSDNWNLPEGWPRWP